MPVKIYAALPEMALGPFREALRRCPANSTKLETCGTLLEAVQMVYLLGPPDLLVVDDQGAGPCFGATLRQLRAQPGFKSIRAAFVCAPGSRLPEGCPPDVLTLRSPTSVTTWLDFLTDTFLPAFVVDSPIIPAEKKAAPSRRQKFRGAQRKPLSAPCLVWAGAKKYSGKLRDISMTGARVTVEVELALSGPVHVNVAVPGSQPLKIIQFKALVVRSSPGGYGLAFQEMDQETRHFLKRYTEGKVFDSI